MKSGCGFLWMFILCELCQTLIWEFMFWSDVKLLSEMFWFSDNVAECWIKLDAVDAAALCPLVKQAHGVDSEYFVFCIFLVSSRWCIIESANLNAHQSPHGRRTIQVFTSLCDMIKVSAICRHTNSTRNEPTTSPPVQSDFKPFCHGKDFKPALFLCSSWAFCLRRNPSLPQCEH